MPLNAQQTELYKRFKELVKGVVEKRRPHLSDVERKEGLVGAYDNSEYFVQYVESRFKEPDPPYHDWNGFGQWLEDRKKGREEDRELIKGESNRLKREGFSYLDVEEIRYNLPDPEDDDTPGQGFAR